MRTSTPSQTEAVMELLTGTAPVRRAHAERLYGRTGPDHEILALTDTLEGVRLSRPRLLTESEGPEEGVTALSVESGRGVRADLFVAVDDDGTLGGLRMTTRTPRPADPAQLREALSLLDPEAAVLARTDDTDVADHRVKAVASLIKIFVQLAVMRAVERGELHLGHRHALLPEDVSLLSAGLGAQHVGTRITVAELCRLMVLRSDNTATDALIGLVGRRAVVGAMTDCGVDPGLNDPFRTMRESARASWGTEDLASSDRPDARTTLPPVHQMGLDYYAPLTAVASAMEQLAAMSWSPWPTGAQLPPGAPVGVMYKGGNAPGVLSTSWVRRSGHRARSLMFAVNTAEPLGMLEEVYAFTCAESTLSHLGLIH